MRIAHNTIEAYKNHRAFAGGFINDRKEYLAGLTEIVEKHNPSAELAERQRKLLEQRLKLEAYPERLTRMKLELEGLDARLESVNPENVLKRGYSYVESADGNALDSVDKVKPDQEVRLVFRDGSARGKIIEVDRKETT